MPAIDVDKTANPSHVLEPGDTVTFTVRVTNVGPKTVTLTSLVDSVYGDLNGQGTCAVPQTIEPGASYECSFSARVTGNAGYTETDIVTGSAVDDEGNPAEDSDQATVIVDDALPVIRVNKTANPSSMTEPGGTVIFAVRVTNDSREPVILTSLIDDIHGDLNGQGTCSVPQTIAVGSSYQCTFSAEVTGSAGYSETDTVTARVTDDEGNIAEASDSATVSINGGVVCPASLKIQKYHDLNGNGTQDENEPFLSGWIFRITVGGQVFDVVTDENGSATLGGLQGGDTATIEERLDVLPDQDWLSTTGNPIQTTLECGENLLRFGNARGKPPKTGRGGERLPDAGSLWLRGALIGGMAVFLALVAFAGRPAALLAAGRSTLPPQGGRRSWLTLPLILLAIVIRRLTRRRR